MKKTITAAIFLFALTASAAFGQTTADEWYTKAGEYFESGDYANAITAYSETIKRDSSNLNAYWFRGIAYFRIKNYDAAIADCNTVIKGMPDVPDGYIARGDAYGAKGVYHTAAADYKTGLEKGYDPNGFGVDKSSKADMWFCGAMFMEITVNRFLGKSDAAAKYENWLKTVCDRNKLTRAEIEAFYRHNIGALIADAVDVEFNKISFMVDNTTSRTSYDAVLTLNPKTGQYILNYKRLGTNYEPIIASTLDALPSVMLRSGNFNQTSINQVRAQAALIPAAKLSPLELGAVKDILTLFYLTPNAGTYRAIRDVAIVYHKFTGARYENREAYLPISAAYGSAISALNQALSDRIAGDVLGVAVAVRANSAEEVRQQMSFSQ